MLLMMLFLLKMKNRPSGDAIAPRLDTVKFPPYINVATGVEIQHQMDTQGITAIKVVDSIDKRSDYASGVSPFLRYPG